jgi:hypothetical protein
MGKSNPPGGGPGGKQNRQGTDRKGGRLAGHEGEGLPADA